MAKRITQIDKNLKTEGVKKPDELLWLSSRDKRLTMRGLAWYEENQRRFNRFPLRAEKIVRPDVWTLARCPASARICFRSDTTRFAVKVTNEDLPHTLMPHMPFTGSHGLFLYVGEGPHRMKPWAPAVPDMVNPHYEREMLNGLPKKMREFALYLPLYAYLEELEIGLSQGAKIGPPSPSAVEQPVVFYGTSITQGGCASNPGADFVSAVGRMLNLDVINLGFSGNGRGEPEVAKLISEIDASLFVLDYAANSSPESLEKTLPDFFQILRDAHPATPILLISQLSYWSGNFSEATRQNLEAKRDVMIHFYSKMKKAGEKAIHFVDGYALVPFGTDFAFVDGGHPTTAGFQCVAERLAPFIEQILLRDN